MQRSHSMASSPWIPSIELLKGPAHKFAPAADSGCGIDRQRWIARCIARLAELRPQDDEIEITALAVDLWKDVGGFDPELSAEMEHECLAASE